MRKSLVTIGLAAASLATIAGLAGCGGSAPTGQAAPNSAPASQAPVVPQGPVNPVPILRQAGFKPDKGEVYGHAWIAGLQADASVMDAHGIEIEHISVNTTGDQDSFNLEQSQNTPGDDLGVVTVPDKLTTILVETYPDTGTPPQTAQQIAQQIAKRVHGLVIEPQA